MKHSNQRIPAHKLALSAVLREIPELETLSLEALRATQPVWLRPVPAKCEISVKSGANYLQVMQVV